MLDRVMALISRGQQGSYGRYRDEGFRDRYVLNSRNFAWWARKTIGDKVPHTLNEYLDAQCTFSFFFRLGMWKFLYSKDADSSQDWQVVIGQKTRREAYIAMYHCIVYACSTTFRPWNVQLAVHTLDGLKNETPMMISYVRNYILYDPDFHSDADRLAFETMWAYDRGPKYIEDDQGEGDLRLKPIPDHDTIKNTFRSIINGEAPPEPEPDVPYVIVPMTVTFYDNTAAQKTATLKSNTQWQVQASGWVTITPTNGENDRVLSVSVTENTADDSRTTTVTVTGTGAREKTMEIRQSGRREKAAAISISPSSVSVEADGRNVAISVTATVSWTVTGIPAWITLSRTSGTGSRSISASVRENTSSQRSATLVFSGGGVSASLSVTQAQGGEQPSDKYLEVSDTSLEFDSATQSFQIDVTANVGWTVSVSGEEPEPPITTGLWVQIRNTMSQDVYITGHQYISVLTADGSDWGPINIDLKSGVSEGSAKYFIPAGKTATLSPDELDIFVQGGEEPVSKYYGGSILYQDGKPVYWRVYSWTDAHDPAVIQAEPGSFNFSENGLVEFKITGINTAEGTITPSSSPVDISDGDTPTPASYWDTGLPVVIINTNGRQIPGPGDTWLENATIQIYQDINTILYESSELSIRGRGNSSSKYSKKPYALKLIDKAEILGMEKSKRWCLLANFEDRTLMRNDIAFAIAKCTDLSTGMLYSPSGKFVEVVVNGVHQGNYYLSEQIRAEKKRVNIDETKDYLLEYDRYSTDEPELAWFRTDYKTFPITIKTPDPDDEGFDVNKKNEIKSKIDALETMIYSGNYYLLNMNSFADYWMVEELTENIETASLKPGSVYLQYINGIDGNPDEVIMGPIWDFDYSTFLPYEPKFAGSHLSKISYRYKEDPSYDDPESTIPDNGYMPHTLVNKHSIYFDKLFESSQFRSVVKQRWNAFYSAFQNVYNRFDQMYEYLRASEQLETAKWGTTKNAELVGGYWPDKDMSFYDAV